jgi:hypothetical protein
MILKTLTKNTNGVQYNQESKKEVKTMKKLFIFALFIPLFIQSASFAAFSTPTYIKNGNSTAYGDPSTGKVYMAAIGDGTGIMDECAVLFGARLPQSNTDQTITATSADMINVNVEYNLTDGLNRRPILNQGITLYGVMAKLYKLSGTSWVEVQKKTSFWLTEGQSDKGFSFSLSAGGVYKAKAGFWIAAAQQTADSPILSSSSGEIALTGIYGSVNNNGARIVSVTMQKIGPVKSLSR